MTLCNKLANGHVTAIVAVAVEVAEAVVLVSHNFMEKVRAILILIYSALFHQNGSTNSKK